MQMDNFYTGKFFFSLVWHELNVTWQCFLWWLRNSHSMVTLICLPSFCNFRCTWYWYWATYQLQTAVTVWPSNLLCLLPVFLFLVSFDKISNCFLLSLFVFFSFWQVYEKVWLCFSISLSLSLSVILSACMCNMKLQSVHQRFMIVPTCQGAEVVRMYKTLLGSQGFRKVKFKETYDLETNCYIIRNLSCAEKLLLELPFDLISAHFRAWIFILRDMTGEL